jgi:hypothetical protein
MEDFKFPEVTVEELFEAFNHIVHNAWRRGSDLTSNFIGAATDVDDIAKCLLYGTHTGEFDDDSWSMERQSKLHILMTETADCMRRIES